MSRLVHGVFAASLLLGASACKEEPKPTLAPAASSLGAAAPKAEGATTLAVDSSTSSVKFLMDSPLEKIDGEAPASVGGELFVDPKDLTKSTGLIKIDLDKLSLYQQKRTDEGQPYGERRKNAKQNEHARDWLQLVPREGEVTPEQAQKNRFAEFKLEKVETAMPDVAALSGAERKATASVSGDFLLHGRKAKKNAKLELVFEYAGDELKAVRVKSVEPIPVNLDEFEVHPRDATGKLVQSVTDAIASNLKGKLSNVAPITLEFTARAR